MLLHNNINFFSLLSGALVSGRILSKKVEFGAFKIESDGSKRRKKNKRGGFEKNPVYDLGAFDNELANESRSEVEIERSFKFLDSRYKIPHQIVFCLTFVNYLNVLQTSIKRMSKYTPFFDNTHSRL